MSEQTAEQHEAKPEGEKPQIDVTELQARMERLESSNQRLLDESKSWKGKYQGLKTEIEENQNEQMRETNDFKGLYEKAMQKVQTLEEDVKSGKRSELESTLKYEVAKNAKDAEDVDLVLAALKLKKKDMLGYDREAGAWRGVDEGINDLRKSNPGLFKSDIPGMESGRPQSVPTKTEEELINEDPNSVLTTALSELLK